MPARRKPTAAQIEAAEARRAEILAKLSDGIDRLTDSAEWQRYLDVQSRFHQYSFANTMLILCQRPDATRVASFKKWLELDRCVNKGETGIRIWAPRGNPKGQAEPKPGEEKTDEPEVPTSDKAEPKSYATRFVMVPVFDVAQTSGTELPEPVKLLDGQDQAGVFGKLTKVAESIGYRVQVTPEIDGHAGANGLCEYGLKTLTVAGNRAPAQQVKSLAHEIGHALLHDHAELSRGTKELEAESTAYVVCQSLGLDTSDYSFGYVAGWQNGDAGQTREQIKASGQRISGAARKILDDLEKQAEKTADLEMEMA
jgi:hypothetical protein